MEAVWERRAWFYFTGQAPKDLVVAVGVEGRAFAAPKWLRPRRRVYVNQIHTGVGQLGELFQIIAAINDAGVEEGGWATLTPALSRPTGEGVFLFGGRARHSVRAGGSAISHLGGQGIARPTFHSSLFRHAAIFRGKCGGVNSFAIRTAERRERRAPVRKNPLPGAVNAVRIAC
jgi:hypothetical protein